MGQGLTESFADAAIRPVQLADIDAIMAIEEDRFDTVERYPRYHLYSYIEKSLRDPAITPMLIAGSGDDPAGYVLGLLYKNGTGEIGSLAVATAHEGHGLGRALLQKVSDSLRNAGAIRLELEVRVDNPAAIHVYETEGFVNKGVLKGHYSTEAGEVDGYKMIKTFDRPAAKPSRL
jgi:ribosomal protein S18 acetylase RimI-like enzyme